MNHDHLCDWLQKICTTETCPGLRIGDPCEHMWCQCDLIVKVRNDERRQAVERVRAKKGKFPSTRLDWGTIADAILDGTKLRLSKKELHE